MSLLEITNLKVHYGGVSAVDGVDLEVSEMEAVVLIGANGMGKSSLLRAILGLVPCTSYSMRFAGRDISGADTRERVSMGLALVPESRELFPKMTVIDNLLLGGRLAPTQQAAQDALDRALDMFPALKGRLKQRAGTLSGGEQQMLAISRALMQSPRLLCLDEPSLGLAPMLVAAVFEKLHQIRAAGTAILLVEQQARQAINFGDRGYVLALGKMVRSGTCQQLSGDPLVMSGYLGQEE